MFCPVRPTTFQSRTGGTSSSPTPAQNSPHTGGPPLRRDPGLGADEEGKGARAFRPGEAAVPQGTPSTFKKVTSTLAPQPQTPRVLGEVQPAETALPSPPATPPQSPGQPSGHPAPTSPGASPLGADPSRSPLVA